MKHMFTESKKIALANSRNERTKEKDLFSYEEEAIKKPPNKKDNTKCRLCGDVLKDLWSRRIGLCPSCDNL